MATKSSKTGKTRKPARTIDQQIADLQAKAAAQKKREIERLAAKIESATVQHEAALVKTEKIKATLIELTERYNELIDKDPEAEPESDNEQETSGE